MSMIKKGIRPANLRYLMPSYSVPRGVRANLVPKEFAGRCIANMWKKRINQQQTNRYIAGKALAGKLEAV